MGECSKGASDFISRVEREWRLEKRDLSKLFGFGKNARVFAKFRHGEKEINREQYNQFNERIEAVTEIYLILSGFFKDQKKFRTWMREPQKSLVGEKPLNLLLKGDGRHLVILKEYVDYLTQ